MVITSILASMATWFTPTVLFCVVNLMVGTIFIASNFKSHNKDHDQNKDSPTPLVRTPSLLLERVKSVNFSSFYPFDQPEHNSSGQLARAPSLLERVRSINFSSFYTNESEQEPQQPQPHEATSQLARAPSLLERVRSFNFSSFSTNESEQVDNSPGQLDRAPSLLDRVKSFKISAPFMPGNADMDSDTQPDHHVIRSKSEQSAAAPAMKSSAKMKKSRSEMRMAADDDEEEDFDRRRPATMREVRTAKEDESVDAKADDFINKFKQQLKLQRLDSLLRYREMLNRGTSSR